MQAHHRIMLSFCLGTSFLTGLAAGLALDSNDAKAAEHGTGPAFRVSEPDLQQKKSQALPPNPIAQRNEMIDQLKAMNARLQNIEASSKASQASLGKLDGHLQFLLNKFEGSSPPR